VRTALDVKILIIKFLLELLIRRDYKIK